MAGVGRGATMEQWSGGRRGGMEGGLLLLLLLANRIPGKGALLVLL